VDDSDGAIYCAIFPQSHPEEHNIENFYDVIFFFFLKILDKNWTRLQEEEKDILLYFLKNTHHKLKYKFTKRQNLTFFLTDHEDFLAHKRVLKVYFKRTIIPWCIHEVVIWDAGEMWTEKLTFLMSDGRQGKQLLFMTNPYP